jgi:cell division protein FtsZ
MPEVHPQIESFASLKIIGFGGGGGNAVQRMFEAEVKGIDFIAVNTDAQDLHHCNVPEKLHIGKTVTRGLGAGMDPELGRQAAEESQEEIASALEGADMVFLVAGLGGGTGTGCIPVGAELARQAGALTVAVVTKPFSFEGSQRAQIAEDGLAELQGRVDTLITIPNDRILNVIDSKTSLLEAFQIVDDVLLRAVQGIAGLITLPGIINVDFADVKAIMKDAGSALMGIGRASGEERAIEAARQAINSPLLEVSIDGAQGVLFNITGGEDLKMSEVNKAAQTITETIDPEAKVVFGAVRNDDLPKGQLQVTVIATGFSGGQLPKRERIQEVREIYKVPSPVQAGSIPSAARELPVEEEREAEPSEDKLREPAFPRRPSFEAETRPIQEQDDETKSDIEVPAFIRKKLKELEQD